MHSFRSLLLLTIMATLTPSHSIPAAEIDFVEEFVLATDRAEAIQKLVPGTNQYYFYQCLHFQNSQRYAEVDRLLVQWEQRHGVNAPLQEIRHRQMLLTYGNSPRKTLDYLIQELDPNLHHQKDQLEEKPELPSRLDPNHIRFETLKGYALRRHKGLEGFQDTALYSLRAADLDPLKRRQFLSRLSRPTHAELLDLIVADLKYKGSGGFGSLKIHGLLTIAQLDELASQQPALENQTKFVNIYLQKLRPSADVDWRNDPQAQNDYLLRMWRFANQLNASHNSLKAHILYHWLVLDESQGNYNKRRFLEYLQLPRPVNYVAPRLMEHAESQRYPVDLNLNPGSVTRLPPIHNDEALVRRYLLQLLAQEKNFLAYEPYIRDDYLRQVFAEAKITTGTGDATKWYALLRPEQYQALKERVDLDFAPSNRSIFRADAPVEIDLLVKNVEKLIVKIYEINTENYYRTYKREVNTDIKLDGLIANEETTHTYNLPSERRERRHFEFPGIQKPGVYVVDFIGNGKSSRAVVRKGQLHFVEQSGPDGHVFTVFDDQLQTLKDAKLWMAGRQYLSDDDGKIVVPFSTNPGQQQVILTHGNLSSLHSFGHSEEDYALHVAAHIDREALVERQEATVLLRPELRLAGAPITLHALHNVQVRIQSTSAHGIQSEKVMNDVDLLEDRDTPLVFLVPEQLVQLNVSVTAKITDARKHEHTLTDSYQVRVNGIDQSNVIEDLHLTRLGNEYLLQLLGKTGEPRPFRPVRVSMTHRDFTQTVDVNLATDDTGVITLGALPGITQVSTTGAGPEQQYQPKTWVLAADRRSRTRAIHGREGQALLVPHMLRSDELDSAIVSLFELRGGSYAVDRTNLVRVRDNFAELRNLKPGDYSLKLGRATPYRIRITEGESREGYALGTSRHLQLPELPPLHVTNVAANDTELRVQLANASPFSRVHVYATRFVPAFDPFQALGSIRDNEPLTSRIAVPKSYYVAGRELGDELRYVLDRTYATKFPGNMLQRPTLLLNAWAVQGTETDTRAAEPGGKYEAAPDSEALDSDKLAASQLLREEGLSDFANLDFLAESTMLVANLKADETGLITVPLDDLGPHQHFQVVAVDPITTVYRSFALPKATMPFRDIALHEGLPSEKHFTKKKEITLLAKGEQFELADIATGQIETYDSLSRVFSLLSTLSANDQLRQFQFILNWHEMTSDEKRDKYSEFACHELSFFLYKKDPEFFATVVRPYLENKQHKTFLDLWLLEMDLTPFLLPWEYAQLNVAERLLLGERIDGEDQRARRLVEDLFGLIPRDVSNDRLWFDTAIQGQALDYDSQLGLIGKSRALSEERLSEQLDDVAPGLSGGYGGGGGGFGFGAVAANAADDDEKSLDSPGMARRKERARAQSRRSKSRGRNDQNQYFFSRGAGGRPPLYVKLEKTQEWAENNYYHLPLEQQATELVQVNAFWHDYAQHQKDEPFFSTHWPVATRNFTEIMFTLSLLDLPFTAAQHESSFEDRRMTLTAASPVILFQEQIREATAADDESPILITQNYFRDGDRYQMVNGERRDKFVTDEFLSHTVYGCQIVVTNPTSTQRTVQLLTQIPHHAISTNGGKDTDTIDVSLAPFRTETFEYTFYFPHVGEYAHFPVHVSQDDTLLGFAKTKPLRVVATPTNVDKQSWDYVSQFANNAEVLEFLQAQNVFEIDLGRMAFRMTDKAFFSDAIALLQQRHCYDHGLWAYGLKHNHRNAIEAYLKHEPDFLNACGDSLVSDLVVVDPIARRSYQHLDYKPLVNARAHQLGGTRQILNDRFHQQYHRLLNVLRYHQELDSNDRMAMTYYLLLQDRIEVALEMFKAVSPSQLETQLQYDYFAAYLDCYRDAPTQAREIVTRYANYPVPKWEKAFAAIKAMIDEVDGQEVLVVDPRDRNQAQISAAAEQPNFDFHVEDQKIHVNYQHVDQLQINFYVIDLELLFSSQPFVQQFSGQFSHVRPNHALTVELPTKQKSHRVDLPEALQHQNILVEIVANGITRSQPYFSNSLTVQVSENFGQLKVTETANGRPLPKTYIKVYAEFQHGQTVFYKDGYTDLRGRFDYSSLSTNELDQVKRFSLLVLDEHRGGLVREATPPKR